MFCSLGIFIYNSHGYEQILGFRCEKSPVDTFVWALESLTHSQRAMLQIRVRRKFENRQILSTFKHNIGIKPGYCVRRQCRRQSGANVKESYPLKSPQGGKTIEDNGLQKLQDDTHLLSQGLIKSNRTVENVAGVGIVLLVASLGLYALDSNPWTAYETAVKMNPIETKACISGIVYSMGDLIAQNYEGRDISEWDRGRIIRSGLCGLLAHGPLSHLYYLGLDTAFAQQSLVDVNSWISPVIKVGIDQTLWSIFWNSTYYVLLGILKAESPKTIISSVRQSWWDLLKAGWRLWPIVHICTYGIIPVQHRLLFVDAVELVWVCILSTYGQQQRESRELLSDSPSWVTCALPGQAGEGGDFAEEILRGMSVENEIVFEAANGEKLVKSAQEVFSPDTRNT